MIGRAPLIALLAAAALLEAASPPDLEIRINRLPARMTLDEKIGQMSQSTSIKTPLSEQIKDEIRRGRWGSFLNAGSPADRAEAQRIALRQSRLGIPLLFGRDVIHGYVTIFPIPLEQAASGDPALVLQAARIAAQEASAEGIRWIFAPMIDIARDPRWGRVAESLGEDPYLASVYADAMVRGFQTKSLSAPDALAATAKHYVSYGAAGAGREYNSAWILGILLRNVYLPPFRGCFRRRCRHLHDRLQRSEWCAGERQSFHAAPWNFDGMVVSDYTSIPEMIQHGYASDASDAARNALRAGVDMEMVSTTYFDHLKSLIASGQVDNAARNILRLKFRLGLFDVLPTAGATAAVTPATLDAAKRLATESVVLLKNEGGVLPLPRSIGRVAVIPARR